MRVAHENDVDAWNLFRNRDRLVLMWNLPRIYFTRAQILAQAHVHRDDDDVRLLLLAQDRNPLARFVDGFVKLEARVVRRVVPVGNARSRQTEDADSYARDFLHNVWLVMWFLCLRVVCIR